MIVVLLMLSACSNSESDPGARQATPQPTPQSRTSQTPPPAPSSTDDPLSPRPALESAPPLGQPTCRAGNLTVTDADAVIDDEWVEVFVVRTTSAPCQLQGYPEVRLFGAGDAALGLPVSHDARPAGPVTLSRSTSLSFTLTTKRSGTCRDVTSVDVRLPGQAAVLKTATAFAACDRVTVGPFERRSDDEDEGSPHNSNG